MVCIVDGTIPLLQFAESMPVGHCVVKLDFSNAFNSLNRDAMLAAVKQKVAGIYKFCLLS